MFKSRMNKTDRICTVTLISNIMINLLLFNTYLILKKQSSNLKTWDLILIFESYKPKGQQP